MKMIRNIRACKRWSQGVVLVSIIGTCLTLHRLWFVHFLTRALQIKSEKQISYFGNPDVIALVCFTSVLVFSIANLLILLRVEKQMISR
jgi:hypothetical protein